MDAGAAGRSSGIDLLIANSGERVRICTDMQALVRSASLPEWLAARPVLNAPFARKYSLRMAILQPPPPLNFG